LGEGGEVTTIPIVHKDVVHNLYVYEKPTVIKIAWIAKTTSDFSLSFLSLFFNMKNDIKYNEKKLFRAAIRY
jgi:hypothetical protein